MAVLTSKRPDRPQATLRAHPVELVLRLFADVRAGEGRTVLLLTLNLFLLLTAYYMLKVAREPLILQGGRAELKTYAAAGQAVTLVIVASSYGWLARRLGRMRLMAIVSVFFISNLCLFWMLGTRGVALGVPFYLWVGVYSLAVITQFWAFCADVYTEAQGRRLFPIIGIGGSLGSVAGAFLPRLMLQLGPLALMLTSAGLLLLALGVTYLVHSREHTLLMAHTEEPHDAPVGGASGFELLSRDGYLVAIGVLALIINCVNTTGEYIFDRTLLTTAHARAGEAGLEVGQYIESIKSTYFLWVNVVGTVVQLFFVSRVIKYLGVGKALLVMPLVSLVGYGSLAVAPVLLLTLFVKVAENGLDYSLQNTARNALWLVTSREAKYKAKQVTDTVIVRMGDVMSAIVVWTGTKLAFGVRTFIGANIVLVLLWLGVTLYLARAHSSRRESPLPDSRATASA